MASRPSTKRHPVFARFYARISPTMDAQGAVEHRRTLLAGLDGQVLEVGAGNGLNFAHYPPAVTEVLAVEPEPYLRGLVEVAARQAPVSVRVRRQRRRSPGGGRQHGRRGRLPGAVLGPRSGPCLGRAPPGCCDPEGSYASLSTSERTPSAWPGSSGSPTTSGPPWWAAVTPAATPWPPSPPPGSRSPALSGSGSPRAGCHSRPHPTSLGSPTADLHPGQRATDSGDLVS
jgi:hypothetical protein